MTSTRRSLIVIILALLVSASAAAQTKTTPININTATAAQLETVKGIGPKMAAAIIAARPFASVEDLTRVKGIKAKRLATLRQYLTVSK